MKVNLPPCLTALPFPPKGTGKCERGCKKRIVRHMQELRCPLDEGRSQRPRHRWGRGNEARRLMDVSISGFSATDCCGRRWERRFSLRSSRSIPGGVRVWSAGCALGQEAYSLRILWALLAEKTAAMPALELWATDVNPAYLERAIEGIYPAGALARVLAEVRARFFRPAGRARSFRVVDELRVRHPLAGPRPDRRCAVCAGLPSRLSAKQLAYLLPEGNRRGGPAWIADSLAPDGYLVIGRKEHLPGFLKGFHPLPEVSCIYCAGR